MIKKLLIPLLLFISHIGLSQTIKLEGYSYSALRYCPTGEVLLEFSGRDVWNNKLHGKFIFTIFVNGVIDPDVRVADPNGGVLPPFETPTPTMSTNSNKEVIFKVVHKVVGSGGAVTWEDGFGSQTNDVRIRAQFRQNFFLASWKTENFYFFSNVVPPGKAVVVGTDNLEFCTSGEIKTVTLPDFPTNSNNAQNCYWHHQWVWELPVGWKVTSETGSLSGATNVYQGQKTVKIQAPTGLLLGNYTLNVRSEDAWPFPINTQSTIYTGAPSQPSALSYNFTVDFPPSICYDNTGNTGGFIATSPLFGPEPTSYEWETNAGNILSNPTTFGATTIQFNNPGPNRYVRVRSVGTCGTSSWLTQYFDLTYEPFGCGGGGIGGGLLRSGSELEVEVFPNPTIDDLKISLNQTGESVQETSDRPNANSKVILVDNQQRIVYEASFSEDNHTIPVRNLPHGLYFLTVINEEGTMTKKIILDR